MTNRQWTLLTTTMLLLLTAGLVAAGQQRERDDRAALMRRKLDHASRILEGISLEDFEAVRQGTAGLRKAGEAARWHVLPTDDYLRFSREFGRLLDRLEASAVAEELDASALANVQLMLNCIDCHKYVRISLREPPPSP